MNLLALIPVGKIDVPGLAMKHIHVREARAIAETISDRIERIIGTTNHGGPRCELYGWGPNVFPHKDDCGYVYFCPLLLRFSKVSTRAGSCRLRRGIVYRLHDFDMHWTDDSAPVVCLYFGVIPNWPHDRRALAVLQEGVNQLAAGGRDAPRVKEPFRAPLYGECYADTPTGTRLVTFADAFANRWMVANCANCDEPAVIVDRYWPNFTEHNRCRQHLGAV